MSKSKSYKIQAFEIPQNSNSIKPQSEDIARCELSIGFEEIYDLPQQPASVLLTVYRDGVSVSEIAISPNEAQRLAAKLTEGAHSIEANSAAA